MQDSNAHERQLIIDHVKFMQKEAEWLWNDIYIAYAKAIWPLSDYEILCNEVKFLLEEIENSFKKVTFTMKECEMIEGEDL